MTRKTLEAKVEVEALGVWSAVLMSSKFLFKSGPVRCPYLVKSHHTSIELLSVLFFFIHCILPQHMYC